MLVNGQFGDRIRSYGLSQLFEALARRKHIPFHEVEINPVSLKSEILLVSPPLFSQPQAFLGGKNSLVGIARGKDKEAFARQLGAATYIDSLTQDPTAELLALGGARVILATATSGEAISAVQGGLAVEGTLLIVGAVPSMQVSPLNLIMGNRSVKGWYSGTSIDTQDTLAFSARCGVRSMNEVYPLERAAEAYDRMMSGQARFRVVLAVG